MRVKVSVERFSQEVPWTSDEPNDNPITQRARPRANAFAGAVGDHGLSVAATPQGKPSKKGNTGYRLFTLERDSILLNTKQLESDVNNNNAPPTTQNRHHVLLHLRGHPPATIIRVTKAYAGISGTINVTVSFAGTGPKLKNGQCNQNASPIATYGSVAGTGTVSFG